MKLFTSLLMAIIFHGNFYEDDTAKDQRKNMPRMNFLMKYFPYINKVSGCFINVACISIYQKESVSVCPRRKFTLT